MRLQAMIPSAEQLRTPDFDEFCGIARDFLEPLDPAEVLDAIERDDVAQARLHPNGFYVIYLSDPVTREDGQLRLHIWHKDEKLDRAKGDIHTHPWHIAGKVLVGEYAEHIADVRPVDNQDTANFVSIRMEQDAQTGETRHLDPEFVTVELSNLRVFAPGDVHNLAEPEYHYTPVASSALLITLALMGRTISSEKRLLIPKSATLKPLIDPHPFTETVATDLVLQQVYEARDKLA